MENLIFPIFAFGCVITGIVFLGVLQARDFARSSKVIAAHASAMAHGSKNGGTVAATPALTAVKRLSGTSPP